MPKKRQILVIGNNENGCTPELELLAYEVGKEVAISGSVLITGGLGGVMRAACHGAHDAGGLTVGIIPQDDASFANEYCDIVIPSGLGLSRDFLNALASDGVIVVGGGSGTLSEMCAAYMHKKPIAALRKSGGMAAKFADQYLDHRQNVKIVGVDTPQDAVKYILDKITA
ncbi:TIGR00725 family protein [Candidatus Nitrosotenuis uzonensis]|uniref:Rossmann fold nucleotide-binding protein-like protein n=1 Tax=Candidatus Nitrosotenuis uzonensis TaxID=1407055 RepID=V6ATN0_9ARCH|nr:TIGR00725 family protein [Candidatus Nitrosotenuis uzonensis]CDI05793.1 Rossmann fold nucleotide-binding protein-like protein [Candidatus Nitrosotenuis uzonensis]